MSSLDVKDQFATYGRDDQPTVLAYATRAQRRSITRIIWLAIPISAIISFVVWRNTDSGHSWLSCRWCGARAFNRHVYMFGVGGTYGWKINEGPIAKFVQGGTPCAHIWEFADGYWGRPLRNCGGSGIGLGRLLWIGRIEAYPEIQAVLRDEARVDHRLRERTLSSLATPWDDAALQLEHALVELARASELATTMPTLAE